MRGSVLRFRIKVRKPETTCCPRLAALGEDSGELAPIFRISSMWRRKEGSRAAKACRMPCKIEGEVRSWKDSPCELTSTMEMGLSDRSVSGSRRKRSGTESELAVETDRSSRPGKSSYSSSLFSAPISSSCTWLSVSGTGSGAGLGTGTVSTPSWFGVTWFAFTVTCVVPSGWVPVVSCGSPGSRPPSGAGPRSSSGPGGKRSR